MSCLSVADLSFGGDELSFTSRENLNVPEENLAQAQRHNMVTKIRSGFFKQKVTLTSLVEVVSYVPTMANEAIKIPHLNAKYSVLMKNQTGSLVPYTGQKSVVDCKWIFKIKYNFDGTISR